jgi:hypothetical protein
LIKNKSEQELSMLEEKLKKMNDSKIKQSTTNNYKWLLEMEEQKERATAPDPEKLKAEAIVNIKDFKSNFT